MDLEEWELLPDDGFLEIHDDGGKKIFSRKYGGDPKGVFKMNYFICPSTKSQKIANPPQKPRVPNQLVPVPIQLEPTSIGKALDHEAVKEVTKDPIELSVVPSVITEKARAPPHIGALGADQDTVSQVFFKKMKENEFVDMKMDSPKSSGRGIVPQIDAGTFPFEERTEAYKGEAMEGNNGSRMQTEKETVTKKNSLGSDTKTEEVPWEEKNGGLNIWKWSLNGIGAICTFGVAAASVCIIIFGSHQKAKQQNQKHRFQIYTDDKRMKQVVHRPKLNEAISAARVVPLTTAQIAVGGYYEGL